MPMQTPRLNLCCDCGWMVNNDIHIEYANLLTYRFDGNDREGRKSSERIVFPAKRLKRKNSGRTIKFDKRLQTVSIDVKGKNRHSKGKEKHFRSSFVLPKTTDSRSRQSQWSVFRENDSADEKGREKIF